MKTKIITILFIGLLGLTYWIYRRTPVDESDIYVDRLVYLKKDSSLFTGKLKWIGEASYSYVNFSNGVPCKEWAEHQKGGSYVSKGKYLEVKENLSKMTLRMLSNDTVIIDYWQEGGDLPSDPYYLSIFILKNDEFFQSDKKQYDSYIEQLAKAVFHDTQHLKYDYLKIIFVNAVYNWNKDYTKEYKKNNIDLVG